jgi:flagellar basal-body rod modification protein FlgD
MVDSIGSQYQNYSPTQLKGQQLDQKDFLRLMTAQLSAQDPFNPVDNQEMVAQMAQFSSLAGVSETNTALKGIAEQLTAQTALLKDIKAAQLAQTPTTPATPAA